MSQIEVTKDVARKPDTVRESVHALVENIAQQLEDAIKLLRVSGDNGAELDRLLADLKAESGGIAQAAIKNTVADDTSPSDPETFPKSNPVGSTTVGGTAVNTDLSRIADEGEAAFKAADGTIARFPQAGD